MEPVVGASARLEVDIELGKFQLHVADIMQEEHEDAHIVVPGEGSGMGEESGSRCRKAAPQASRGPLQSCPPWPP